MKRTPPPIIQQVGFDFRWDEKKVWELDLPTEELPIAELLWHLDVPFLWSQPDGYYDLTPREVLEHQDRHAVEYRRVLEADTSFPIDIMDWRGRWVILDGLHRLMKLSQTGQTQVSVRKVPASAIAQIIKD